MPIPLTFIGRNPADATAEAAHVLAGKTAYVKTGLITGTGSGLPTDGSNRTVIDIVNPLGSSDSSYRTTSGGVILTQDADITGIGASLWTLSTDGYCYPNGSWSTYWNGILPAIADTSRIYKVWGKTRDSAPATNTGIRILFNMTTRWSDYWEARIQWDGSRFQLIVDQVTASSSTNRLTQNIGTSIDWPCQWELTLHEHGDAIAAFLATYEKDVPSDSHSVHGNYTVASRQGKTDTDTFITDFNTGGSSFLIRGIRIFDI